MKRNGFLTNGLTFLVCSLWACPLQAFNPSAVDKLLSQNLFAKTSFSVKCVQLETGQLLYEHHADRALIPASNMKVITTAAAIDILGSDFTFDTVFAIHNGNLLILGSGDPLTGDSELSGTEMTLFDNVARALREHGVEKIKGDVIVDASLFDDQRFHPSWPEDQADKRWTAQVSALNLNGNCVDITFTPQSAGQPARYTLFPETSYVSVKNKAVSIDRGSNQIGALRKLNSNSLTLIGKCRREQTINVTIDRPAAYFAFTLVENLNRRGIATAGKLVVLDQPLSGRLGQLPDQAQILHRHRTPLRDVLRRCNADSVNMVAECLLKTISVHGADGQSLQQGSWPNGSKVVGQYLRRLELPADAAKVDDGSGLSRENRLSAAALVRVLQQIATGPEYESFRQTLATPRTGTLSKNRRFAGVTYHGRLYAKSGYISKAWSLSGYCRNEQGDWLAFSVLANGGSRSPRDLIDRVVKIFME